MAATHLREAYDCIVLGSGRTASQIASAVARAGRQTLQLTRESSKTHLWLHPRRNTFLSEVADGLRMPLSSVGVVNAAGKRLTAIRAAATPQPAAARSSAATVLTLAAGCNVACDSPQEITFNGLLPLGTVRSNCIIAVRSAQQPPQHSAIGGIYRDVALGAEDERQATIFATERGGEVFWLVPIAGALWSIGLLRSQTELPVAYETIADAFEDALVACPALTQRLHAAQLVGGLHFFRQGRSWGAEDFGGDVVTLPDYHAWLDPVFSTSDWLGDELAAQFAQLLAANKMSADRLQELRQHWSAVEQLTQERIAPWYQRHEALPAALHDHAQREWYEKLLTGSERR